MVEESDRAEGLERRCGGKTHATAHTPSFFSLSTAFSSHSTRSESRLAMARGRRVGLRVLLTCLLRQIKSLICKSCALMEKAPPLKTRRQREREQERKMGGMHLVEEKEERILKSKMRGNSRE